MTYTPTEQANIDASESCLPARPFVKDEEDGP